MPLPLAQSALLMMGWVPPSDMALNPYKTWLSIAIQHAKSINADHYARTLETSTLSSMSQKNHHNALRRLWWCCVILDRISPLCSRFNLQITLDRFDFKNAIPLGMTDMETEIFRSSVSTAATKRRQILLFSRFLELIVLLTGVLAPIFPFDDPIESKWTNSYDDDLDLERSDVAMKDWYARTIIEFPPCRDEFGEHIDREQGMDRSILIHTNLMYIYY